MGDYFAHWLEMGKKIRDTHRRSSTSTGSAPTMKATSSGPASATTCASCCGSSHRCEGKVDAVETAIGYVPKAEDINIEGLDGVTIDTIKNLLSVDVASWKEDCKNIREFYGVIGDHMPKELYEELDALEKRLG